MEKFSKIAKQVLLFLVIFLIINYIFSFFQDDKEDLVTNGGNVLFTTTDTEYGRNKKVTVKIVNGTNETLTIPSECPEEPFTVLMKENNEWTQKTAAPELDCENAKDIKLPPGEKIQIPYDNWNYELFGQLGLFKIAFTTELDGEETTMETNEFLVVKEGIFSQLWSGVFYRPIYNGLIYLTSVLPGNSLGLAIIILTLIIRTLLLVPTQKAMQQQRKLQEIQPRLEKIKEKYKGDQQKIAMETMAIWKDAKVNPMGSCLPILLQFPFLIAIFYVVRDGLNPDYVHLLYTQYQNFSITDINHFFLWMDLTKTNTYVLPLIIGALQFIQMKLSMHKAQKNRKKEGKEAPKNEMAMATNTMMYIMPVMIAVFTASLPAGVGIYWGTSTIYGIIQQVFVNKGKSVDSQEPKVRVIEANEKKRD